MTRQLGRKAYTALALGMIALGLASHFLGDNLPRAARDFAGDALWASMVFWWVSAIAPTAKLRNRVTVAILISAAVELTQLYHTPALDTVRATTIGHLVLGSDFDARDLVAYCVGVLAASLGEWIYVLQPEGTAAS